MQRCAIPYIRVFLAIAIAQNSIVESFEPHETPSGCILPRQPIGGRYWLDSCIGDSCSDVPGSRVPSGSFISYRCNDGYVLMGNNLTACHVNAWYMPPSCVKACPALRSLSVDITCRHRGVTVSCKIAIVPGTKATLACKQFYKIPFDDDPAYREITCLEDGNWDYPLLRCIPECGIAVTHGQPMIVNGMPAKFPGYPWHVGIYRNKSNLNFEQICGGTLVSPHLVVSAAHCFWDDRTRTLDDATKFAVAAGKFYRPYNISLIEPYAQHSQVKEIEISEAYFGYTGNFAHDIALLRLRNPFELSTLIRPICMIWDTMQARQQLSRVVEGKAVGWGITEAGVSSGTLREINLPFISRNNCRAAVPEEFKGFVTPDKFCAGYLNGSSLCQGDSGGGLIFQFQGLWVLGGIVSASPTANGSCDNNYYTAFTNITYFLDWIRSAYLNPSLPGQDNPTILHTTTMSSIGGPAVRISTESGCILPRQPADGSFELGFCEGECNLAPGTTVPIGSSLIYRCYEGYVVEGKNVATCRDSAWNLSPTCVRNRPRKKCPPLRSKTMDFDCTYYGNTVPCFYAVAPWTKATLACKNFYNIPFAHDPGYREITCLEDGNWDRTDFQCIPDCRKISVHPQISWIMNVYRRSSNGRFQFQTPGTLISPGLVIAHTGDSQTDRESLTNVSDLKVVGGMSPTFYEPSSPSFQKSLVQRIYLPDGYHLTDSVSFLVLLHLQSPFTMTVAVSPICLDWYKDILVTPRNMIPREECLSHWSAFAGRLTAGTFCYNPCMRDGDEDWWVQGGSFVYTSGDVRYLWGYYTTVVPTYEVTMLDVSRMTFSRQFDITRTGSGQSIRLPGNVILHTSKLIAVQS